MLSGVGGRAVNANVLDWTHFRHQLRYICANLNLDMFFYSLVLQRSPAHKKGPPGEEQIVNTAAPVDAAPVLPTKAQESACEAFDVADCLLSMSGVAADPEGAEECGPEELGLEPSPFLQVATGREAATAPVPDAVLPLSPRSAHESALNLSVYRAEHAQAVAHLRAALDSIAPQERDEPWRPGAPAASAAEPGRDAQACPLTPPAQHRRVRATVT